MSVSHTISLSYSGGGTSPVASNVVAVGQSELNYNTACASASTTTLAPPLVMDPDARIQSYVFQSIGGNATLAFTPGTGSAVTIGLTDTLSGGQPTVAWADPVTGLIAGVPTSAETYTLSVRVAGSSSITFAGRMCLE